MDMQIEYFDLLANTQKQALNNLVAAQKDLRNQMLDGISKMQSSLTSIPAIPGIAETPQSKEVLNQFNTWFDTMNASTKAFSDQALKTQENWNSAFEKQLDISREVVKSFSGMAKTATSAVKANKA